MDVSQTVTPWRCKDKVLGVDPGTFRCGYGVLDVEDLDHPRYVECGVLEAPKKMDRGHRILMLGGELAEIMDSFGVGRMAYEEGFTRGREATIALSEMRGVAKYEANKRGVPYDGYSPSEVKQFVGGKGNADKDGVAANVRAILGLHRTPEPDAADALAVALTYCFKTRAAPPASAAASPRRASTRRGA